MNSTQLFVIIVIIFPLVLAARRILRPDVAALIIATLLAGGQFIGLGVLGPANTPRDAAKAIAGLGQPVIITLIGLFIVTRALDKTGVTRWLARRLLAIGGHGETQLIILFTVTSAVLSLFMNNLAAGALLLPSAIDVSRRTGIRTSKLLIPVAFGTTLGGSATYFTTANIIISDLLVNANPPQAPLHFLDFTPTGGLIALAGILFIAFFGRKLLPDHTPRPEQMIARKTGTELEGIYRLGDQLWEAQVQEECPYIYRTLAETRVGDRHGLTIAAIWRGREALFTPLPETRIEAGDILLVVGQRERVLHLEQHGLKVGRNRSSESMSEQGVTFIEVVLAPRSISTGQTLKKLEFRKRYGFTAVALLRQGYALTTDIADQKLRPGDSFLMVGERRNLRGLQASSDFIVLEPDISDQPMNRRHATLAASIILLAVMASVAGVPTFLTMLAAGLVVLLAGLITMEEAYRGMEWPAVFLITGMVAASQALVQTGLAELLGEQVVMLMAPLGPLGLAGGVYLLAAALTQVMGGQVTVLVTGPIAISAALHLGINPQALAVATALGCSSTFLTPLSHPINILMMEPGNYTFGDFFRLGWRLTVISFVMLLVGMWLFWGLV